VRTGAATRTCCAGVGDVTVKKRILSFPVGVTNDGVYWRTDRAKEYGAKPPKGRLELRRFPRLREDHDEARQEPVRLRHARAGTWAVSTPTEFMVRQRRPGARQGRQGRDHSKEAAEALGLVSDLFRKHKVCPPSVPTDGWRGIVEGFGRGVTKLLHPQLGLLGGAEGLREARELRHRALPSAAKKRSSFYFSETLTPFSGQGARGRLQIHGVGHEPDRTSCTPRRSASCRGARASPSGRSSPGTGAGRLHQVVPVLDRQPVPRPRGLGPASSTPRACRSSSRRSSQAHGREFLDKSRGPEQEHVVAAMAREATRREAAGAALLTRRARELLTAISTCCRGDRARRDRRRPDRARDPDEPLPQRPDQDRRSRLQSARQLRAAARRRRLLALAPWNCVLLGLRSVSLQFLGASWRRCSPTIRSRAGAAVRTLTLLPWIIPGVVVALIWEYLYQPNYGALNDLLARPGS